MRMVKVFISGQENIGWSLDHDHACISTACKDAGYVLGKSVYRADIVHNIAWSGFNDIFALWLRKKVLLTCSNFIEPENPCYGLLSKWNKLKDKPVTWLCPSSKQKRLLDRYGLKTALLPFFIDYSLFASNLEEAATKEELLREFAIPEGVVQGRMLIGSFQRDSLGTDLNVQKWQKNPEMLVRMLSVLPRERFLLLLAGPRRHYIRQRCKELGIPYWFVGKETLGDDLAVNTLSIKTMARLYRLVDVYAVTSASEGGPKAILECAASRTLCLSTDVGMALDYLDPSCVFSDESAYGRYLYGLVTGEVAYPAGVVEKAFLGCRMKHAPPAQALALGKVYADSLRC